MAKDLLETVDSRILGARLRHAREMRGWTQQKVADEMDLARTTVVAIEKGERRLRPAEIVHLAQLFERQVSELLQGSQPSEGFAVQLRDELRPSALIDADLLPHIEEFERLCEDYKQLEDLCHAPLRRRYPIPYDMRGTDAEIAAVDAASTERRRLDLGDGPLLKLREILESDVGLRIFQLELPSAVAGMFSFTESLGGCIAVNLRHPVERRRQSLAHEYGHFLTRRSQPEIIYLGRYERRPASERFSEAFARSFLMPADGLRRRYLELLREREGSPTHGDLCRLAHFYVVSVEAMTRRLEELRLVPAGVWDRLQLEGFKVEEARQLLGLEPAVTEDGTLPHRFVALAVEAWQRAELSEGQLARYLRTDRLRTRDTIDLLRRSQGSEPSGAIDLSAPLLNVV